MKFNFRPPGGQPLTRYSLELWLRSPRGRRQLSLEERELRRVWPDLFGRHLLQVGSWGREGQLLAAAEMMHRAVLGTVVNPGQAALAEPERIPVRDKAADGVLLPHTLEFARSPHHVLREASRILTDRGRLLVLGFQPWSLWALRHRLGLRYRAFPSGARFVGVGRLFDWLELLDFEVVEVRRFGIGFPWVRPVSDGSGGIERWLGPCAESYLLVARKRVLPLTLVGRAQRAQIKPLVGVPVPGANIRAFRAPEQDP